MHENVYIDEIRVKLTLIYRKTGEQENMVLGRQENRRTWFWKDMRTEEHVFGEDKRTREHDFLEDMRTREHEKKGKGLFEQNENKRFGWALPNTRFLRYPHLSHWIFHSLLKPLDFSLFTLHFSLNHWILHSSFFTLHLSKFLGKT